MVLYRANGRVVKQHEDYLEQAAAREANLFYKRYTEQIDVAKAKTSDARNARKTRVYIIIDEQDYQELYDRENCLFVSDGLRGFKVDHPTRIPEKIGLDRRTLMKCSSFADDFFTYEPGAEELHLPVTYPRAHLFGRYDQRQNAFQDFLNDYADRIDPQWSTQGKKYVAQADDQVSYVRAEEVEEYIVPWLIKMEPIVNDKEDRNREQNPKNFPTIQIPGTLEGKIHLYNVMLHLGISSYFQQPLIDALVLEMYQTALNECHLDTLEMTVGRFYSRGVPVLDPVLNHFIGTYALRTTDDRENPKPSDTERRLDDNPPDPDPRTEETRYLPLGTPRTWLSFSAANAGRSAYPLDTVSVPPKLEVLGHSIRHWSGVRRNGSTAAAHTGYPLNVGKVKKYNRRSATSPIKLDDCVEYSTYRLNKSDHWRDHPPGVPQVSEGDEDADGGGPE